MCSFRGDVHPVSLHYHKGARGTPLQVAVLVSAKSLVSWFAFYANFYPIFRPSKMRSYLVAIHLLGSLPIFFFSHVTNPWFFIFSYALFFASNRASFPTWSQILKSSIGTKKMGWVISKGTSVNYALNIGLPLLFGYWMDTRDLASDFYCPCPSVSRQYCRPSFHSNKHHFK